MNHSFLKKIFFRKANISFYYVIVFGEKMQEEYYTKIILKFLPRKSTNF